MKSGTVITVDFGNSASNTFIVSRVLDENKVLVYHPLNTKVFFEFSSNEVNKVPANLKEHCEKSLFFIKKNLNLLSHNDVADFESLATFFIQNRLLTNRQKRLMLELCGKISTKLLNYSLHKSTEIIMNNLVLLDEFSTVIFNNYKNVIKNPSLAKTPNDRHNIYSLAGFILAQLNGVIE